MWSVYIYVSRIKISTMWLCFRSAPSFSSAPLLVTWCVKVLLHVLQRCDSADTTLIWWVRKYRQICRLTALNRIDRHQPMSPFGNPNFTGNVRHDNHVRAPYDCFGNHLWFLWYDECTSITSSVCDQFTDSPPPTKSTYIGTCVIS